MNFAKKSFLEDNNKPITPKDFIDEADLINCVVLGMRANKYREANNMTKKESIRDRLSKETLDIIETLEVMNTQLINCGLILSERYYRILDFYNRRYGDVSKLLSK